MRLGNFLPDTAYALIRGGRPCRTASCRLHSGFRSQPLAARSRSAKSSFSICHTAPVTRFTFAGSSPFNQSQIFVGWICHGVAPVFIDQTSRQSLFVFACDER